MSEYERRRGRLIAWMAQEAVTGAELARRMGCGPNYISSITNNSQGRAANIGERAARKIEVALGMPRKFLDGEASAPESVQCLSPSLADRESDEARATARREQLVAWMLAHDVNQSELARRLGIQPSYVSCILHTGERKRRIGEGLARRIEQVLGMPQLMLDDVERPVQMVAPAATGSVDWRTLALVVADRCEDQRQRARWLEFCSLVDAESARLGRLIRG